MADEFRAGTSTDLVRWLATAAYPHSSLITEQAMQRAASEAFDRYAPRERSSRGACDTHRYNTQEPAS
ncbi:hypothetical protein ABZT06_48705 [Streptomyces sp. NPDC005483]|uniref:hypothetical protein n=1 Tax=Streptomyces sp. NPDC005483 TaxID=3154882 RepID=UPI0033A31974